MALQAGTNDLNDDLSDLLGSPLRSEPVTLPAGFRPIEERVFTEPCAKCRGSGRFVGWSGRSFGACFTCKGTGKHTFKTAPEKRAAARTSTHARKAKAEGERRAEAEAAVEAFNLAEPAIYAWLLANVEKFEFATSCWNGLRHYGSLTTGQLGGVRKCMARDAERATERAARAAAAPTVDIATIEAAFAKARGDAAGDGEGVKWLALRLDTFRFSDAPARGQYAAAVFVTEGKGESKRKLGRISGGKFHRSFQCDDATEARIIAAAADPKAAALAYGQRTGSCSVCGRELTNEESRARAIGPICAEKYGW